MKKVLSIIIATAMVMTLVVVPMAGETVKATTTQPGTYYVSTDGNDTTNNGSANDADHAWLTIQHAVDSVGGGSTVNVATGEYIEQVIINKNLTLSGTGNPTIKSPASPQYYTMTESGSQFEPVVFAFGGTLTGSAVSGTGQVTVNISGITVDGNSRVPSPTSRRAAGILFRNVVGGVEHCTVQNMGDSSSTLASWGILTYGTLDATIHGNAISGYGTAGIGISGVALPGIEHVVIDGNTVTGTTSIFSGGTNGIQVGYGATGHVTNNTVTLNHHTSNNSAGILIVSAPGVIVEGNTVTSNDLGIVVQGLETVVNGFSYSTNTIIRNNKVADNLQRGILIDRRSADTLIEKNTITGNKYGIMVGNATTTDRIPPTGTVIHNNMISGSTDYGLYVYASVSTVDAINNWWGANDGPRGGGHGDRVKINAPANVTFDPWLVIGVSADPASVVANGTSTSTITADMTKNSDSAASGGFVPDGTSITIATTGGTVGSTSVVKPTTSGIATAMLTSSTTAGPVTVSAAAPGDATYGEATTTVTFTSGSTVTLTAVPSSIVADGISTSALTATVKDRHGNPVANGIDVVFTTSKGAVGSSTVTKKTTGGTGTATATLTSAASTEIEIADVSAESDGVSKMIAVFFTPPSAPPITDNTTTTVSGDGTIPDTSTGGSVTVVATGDHTVTTAKYGGNPGGTPSFNSSGNYYDVHLNSATGVNSITIQFSPATASTIIYYWMGTAWRAVSNQAYASSIVTVTVTATTFPSLADLSGLFLGSGTPTPPAPTPTPTPPNPLIGTGAPTSHGSSVAGTTTTTQPVSLPNIQIQSASLSAKTVTPGAPVTVTADIVNKSTVNGSKKVTLYVNGQVETTQGVTVNSGGSSQLTFSVARSEPGDYSVYVDGVPAGSFKVELFRESDGILIFSVVLIAIAFLLGMVMLWRRQRTG